MQRVYNFSPGPSMLPQEVIIQAQSGAESYGSLGISPMEMSHRSKPYMAIQAEAEALLRELMGIPSSYSVLFLQGGASMEFTLVPMNLIKNGKADYVLTGNFASTAYKEAGKTLTARVAASSKEQNFTVIPRAFDFDPEADYVHITTNNTIYGTRYASLPDTGSVPLVADMSSNILSETYDVSKFGLIYAGAQKNMGIGGVTAVILSPEMLERSAESLPAMFSYKVHAKGESLHNTPATWSVYITMLVLRWLKEKGGVDAIEQINIRKAQKLYDCLDASKLFKGTAAPEFRSRMNVTFVSGDEAIDDRFCKEADKKGLSGLKGHRLVGGIRASIYNAMPEEGVDALIDFIKDFEARG